MRGTGLLIAVFLLAGALAFPAQATSQEDADTLYKLGLFKGASSGYELDRAATREEAATMLVRFLGAETAAQAGQWVTPFTDVPDWAKPYVGYAYTNGLIQGVGPNAFGVGTRADANQYATMLLRALGYTSGKDGDFAWDKAAEFAAGLGMDVSAATELPFSRSNMVTLSRTALEQVGKGRDTTLAESLVAAGVIDKAVAQAEGLLPREPIWKNGKLFIPGNETWGYLRQSYPDGVKMIWVSEMTPEAYYAQDLPVEWALNWEEQCEIPVEKRYCKALESVREEFSLSCPAEPLMGYPLPSVVDTEIMRNYGFLIDQNYKILAYCDNGDLSEEGFYLSKQWPKQNTDCVEVATKAMQTIGQVEITVDSDKRYQGWNDGSGMSYYWPVTADRDVDYAKIHYIAWSYSNPEDTYKLWDEDTLRGMAHYILHNDFEMKHYANGVYTHSESQHFGPYSALEYIEEANAWCVWNSAGLPLRYYFYTEDGQALCQSLRK